MLPKGTNIVSLGRICQLAPPAPDFLSAHLAEELRGTQHTHAVLHAWRRWTARVAKLRRRWKASLQSAESSGQLS
eukprot:819398-Pyramimonas_sp.AAC.1